MEGGLDWYMPSYPPVCLTGLYVFFGCFFDDDLIVPVNTKQDDSLLMSMVAAVRTYLHCILMLSQNFSTTKDHCCHTLHISSPPSCSSEYRLQEHFDRVKIPYIETCEERDGSL